MKVNARSGTQPRSVKHFKDLRRFNPPKDVSQKVVRQCLRSPNPRGVAMKVSLRLAGYRKQSAMADELGIHETYLSRLIAGKHNEAGKLPEWFVLAFGYFTRSKLLEQVIDHQRDEVDEESVDDVVARIVEQEARAA
jgi:hypothetical protein